VDPQENPLDTARRELLEETGYEAGAIELLGEMLTDTGRLTNRIWGVLATGARRVEGYEAEAGIETLTYSPAHLIAATTAEFNHALHVAILMLGVAKGAVKIA
jgi:ADP-ribose pyrophosphatase